MPYPILTVTEPLADATPFPGYLYLPGDPVQIDAEDDTRCDYCDNRMTERGTADPSTGAVVAQDPSTGDHDGIVSAIYCPVRGVEPSEAGYSHFRCVLDSGADLSTLTTMTDDPYTVARSIDAGTYEGRHTRVSA